jgi:hypothetical protein
MRFILAITMTVMLILVLIGIFTLINLLLPSPIDTIKRTTTNYITNTQSFVRINYKTNYITNHITNSNELVITREITITEKESITNTILREVKRNNTIGGGLGSGGDAIIYYTHNIFDNFSIGGAIKFNYLNYTNIGAYIIFSYSF